MASPAPPPPLLDPVVLLTTALSAPEPEQRGHLQRAKSVLELQPSQIPTIVGYILPFSTAPGLISDWMVELLELAVCRSTLSVEIKTQLCVQSLDVLASLLPTAQLKTAKILVQIFSSLYPLVFRYLWTNPTSSSIWTTLSKVKERILSWATTGLDEDGKPIKKGLRVQAIKFLQKAVLVQTKGPNDPRLRVFGTDPNLSQCPSDHPFLPVSELEAEGNKLLEFMLLALYTSTDVDVLTSVVNTLPVIIKLRPALAVVFIPALTGWTPEPINGLSRGDIRSVEKVVKVTMSYLEKSTFATAHKPVLQSALSIQSARMEAAYKLALEESRVQIQKRKLDETAAAASSSSSAQQPPKAKRPRWDVPSSSSTPPPPPTLLPSQAGPSLGFPPFPPPGRPPFPPQGMPPPTLLPSHPSYQQPPPPQPSTNSIYNVSLLPISLVIDLLMANLSAVSDQALVEAVREVRRALLPEAPIQPAPVEAVLLRDAVGGGGVGSERVGVNGELKREGMDLDEEEEALNPMDMVGEEEDEGEEVGAEELERLMVKNKKRKQQPNSEPFDEDEDSSSLLPSPSKPHTLSTSTPNPNSTTLPQFLQFQLSNFSLPAPAPLSSSARQALALKALRRIWEAGSHLSASRGMMMAEEDEEIQSSAPARDLWMMLGARLVTRGGLSLGREGVKVEAEGDVESEGEKEDEERRKILCQFVAEEFGERYKFATLWLNEEWYNDSQLSAEDERRSPLYRTSLLHLINLYLPRLSGTCLSRFILDLPDVPLELLSILQALCTDPDRSRGRVGLKTLRDLVVERPPLREDALRNLLELCTHADAGTRNPAIATVRAWVPDNKPWSSTIRTFALQVLRRLQSVDAKARESENGGEQMEGVEGVEEGDGELSETGMVQEEADQIAQSQHLPVKLEMPVEQEVVRQHVELMFALTKKIPEFLDEIFAAYGTLSPSIQEAFQRILAPLIKSLGPNHGKLLTLLRTFPPGADSLALRTLQILSEPKDADTPRVKLSVPLVALVKSLVAERDLDPRFILPIIPELDKIEVKKHLPRIISLLNGKAPERELVRQVVFQLVDSPATVVPPNTPRMRLGQRFTPAELLVLLHRFEKEGGLKPTMEAIDICFSMTEIYKSEVLGVVLQQISDEPDLPTLFLRTVIKSVQTYKSLTPFVATNLLSRLITKKIWTSPQLWEGFIRVAKMLSTSSYPALLQLPRDQLMEIVGREDGKAVKAGLREFVLKKAGGNATRLPAWFSEVFGDQVLPTAGSESPGPVPDPLLAFPGLPGGGESPLSSAPTTPGGGGVDSNGATEMVM